MMYRNPYRGFTLIELLVVISIIALLIALLLPALQQARASARTVQCLSNQRQLAVSTSVYQNDFDGYFPYSQIDSEGSPGNEAYWSGIFYASDYLSDSNVFVCPSFTNAEDPPFTPENFADNPGRRQPYAGAWRDVHYGVNYNDSANRRMWGFESVGADVNYPPLQSSTVNNPSESISMGDTVLDTANFPNVGSHLMRARGTSTNRFPDARHLGPSINLLWADGHASSLGVIDPDDPYNTGLTDIRDSENFWNASD